jgi:hypothetical protein
MIDNVFTAAVTLVLLIGSALLIGTALIGKNTSGASMPPETAQRERVVVIGNPRLRPAGTAAKKLWADNSGSSDCSDAAELGI